ncbi:MAG: hypothetical protein IKH26_10550 [Bacteroidaceae bacterium]|nr:hypothetical protein [Bacteroidaceae bacterium]
MKKAQEYAEQQAGALGVNPNYSMHERMRLSDGRHHGYACKVSTHFSPFGKRKTHPKSAFALQKCKTTENNMLILHRKDMRYHIRNPT